jgi:tetratricopeptide (TPR) repeat protein
MPAARRHGLPVLGAALLLALAVLLASPRAHGAEFTVPPGQNPAAQEELLKNRVSTLARDLVGDKLVDVIAHVGYVRTDLRTGKGPDDRVKLPGFNSFIDASGQGDKVVPEFARVRQIFVIVEEDLALDRAGLERDLRRQGNFNSADGDWLEVVLVRQPPAAQVTEEKEAAPAAPAKEEQEAALDVGPRLPREPLKEPQSTAYLLRARTHYFAGDYHKALDQILQAIRIKPDNSQAYTMLGSIYYTMNWKSLALKYWEIALSLDPENAEISDLITQIRTAQ